MFIKILVLSTIIFMLFSCNPDEMNETKQSSPPPPLKKNIEPKKKPEEKSEKNPILVHFVGNSLTYNNNIPGKFLDILKQQKIVNSNSTVTRTLRGATSLKYLFKEFAVKQILNPSQYVSLQQQSAGPKLHETFDIIGMYQNLAELTGAKIIYYSLWPHYIPKRSTEEVQCGYDSTVKEHSDFAQEHGLYNAPVGSVFEAACASNISEKLTPLRDHHALRAGAYTAALTFIRVIFPKAFPLDSPPTFGISSADAAKIQKAVLEVLPNSPGITAAKKKDPLAAAKIIRPEPNKNITHKIVACRANLFTISGISHSRKLRIQAEDGNYLNQIGAGYMDNKSFTVFRDDGTMIKNEYPFNSYKHFEFKHNSKNAHFVFTPNRTTKNCTERDFNITISFSLP